MANSFQHHVNSTRNMSVRSLVLRLLLEVEVFGGVSVAIQCGLELLEREGRQFLDTNKRDTVVQSECLAFLDEVVIDLPGKEDNSLDLLFV